MDDDEYLNEDEEADETSNPDGEEDVNTETLKQTEVVNEKSLCDSDVIEEKDDYSDDWLYEDDTTVNEGDICSPSSVADEQNESSNKDNGVENVDAVLPSGPHVKTSAITGVGLQELMELIDKKLSEQDKKLKGAQVVERNVFDRKWRPSYTQDSSIVVEN